MSSFVVATEGAVEDGVTLKDYCVSLRKRLGADLLGARALEGLMGRVSAIET